MANKRKKTQKSNKSPTPTHNNSGSTQPWGAVLGFVLALIIGIGIGVLIKNYLPPSVSSFTEKEHLKTKPILSTPSPFPSTSETEEKNEGPLSIETQTNTDTMKENSESNSAQTSIANPFENNPALLQQLKASHANEEWKKDENINSVRVELEKKKSKLISKWKQNEYEQLIMSMLQHYLTLKWTESDRLWGCLGQNYYEKPTQYHSTLCGIIELYFDNPEGVEILQSLLNSVDRHPSLQRIAVDQIYLHLEKSTDPKVIDERIAFLLENIERFPTDEHVLVRWYTFVSTDLVWKTTRYSDYEKVYEDCVRKVGHLQGKDAPMFCYFNYATMWTYRNEQGKANDAFLDLYRRGMTYYYNKHGEVCSGTVIPIGIDSFTLQQRNETNRLITADLISTLRIEKKFLCGLQTWPIYLDPSTGKVVEYKVNELNKIRCISDLVKQIALYELKDVFIIGPMKSILESGEDGKGCTLYVPGYPYVNSNVMPRYNGVHNANAPIVHVEKALILPILDTNYYHFTIEAATHIVLALLYDPSIQIVGTATPFFEDFANIFGFHHRVVIYSTSQRIFVEKAYVMDYYYTESDNALYAPHDREEYFVPPASALLYLQERIKSKVYYSGGKINRDLVVFLHRNSTHRNIVNANEVYNELRRVCEKHGFKFQLHEDDGSYLSAQVKRFLAAQVIIGTHGAGLTNMIFAQPNTHIIELPVYPERVSVYSRIASALDFPYWIVPSCYSAILGNLTATPMQISHLTRTLEHILKSAAKKPLKLTY